MENIKVDKFSDMRAKFLGVISYRRNTRLRMSILLMSADIICFLLAGGLAIVVRPLFNTPLRFELFQQTLPILIDQPDFFWVYWSLSGSWDERS